MEEENKNMRLFDTELFDQEWFGELSPRLKLLYIYSLMKCDCAGVIELNMRKFTFDINCTDNPITREELFDSFGGRIIPLGGTKENCTKAIIPDFIRFHYGKRLVNDRKHNIHRSVVKRIKTVGLTLEKVCELATKKFEFDNFDDVKADCSEKQGELSLSVNVRRKNPLKQRRESLRSRHQLLKRCVNISVRRGLLLTQTSSGASISLSDGLTRTGTESRIGSGVL